MPQLNLNGVTITDDGALNSPDQISVGAGGEIIAHSDGSLEFATGAAKLTADGNFTPACTAESVGDGIDPTHTLLCIKTNDGRTFKLLAVEVIE